MSDYYFRIDKPKNLVSYRNIPFYNQVFLLGSDIKQNTPETLYKYMRIGIEGNVDYTERLLDTLLEGAFWFSTKRYLNDPCEMSYVDIASKTIPPDHPAAIFSMKPLSKDVAENFNLCRINCFSESWKEGPMWANYSNGQRGVCVGFETKRLADCFFPVIYKDEVESDFLQGEHGLLNAFLIKTKSWSYEKEWRLIYPWTPMKIKENINNNNDGLIQSLELPIKEIIFGNQVDQELRNSILNKIHIDDNLKIYETEIKNNIERKAYNN